MSIKEELTIEIKSCYECPFKHTYRWTTKCEEDRSEEYCSLSEYYFIDYDINIGNKVKMPNECPLRKKNVVIKTLKRSVKDERNTEN